VGKALWECGDQPRKGTGYLEGGWRSSDEEKGKWLESCLGRVEEVEGKVHLMWQSLSGSIPFHVI
jgi:hypothetical protein